MTLSQQSHIWMPVSYQICFANIFSQSVGWLFTFLMVSFAAQMFLIWMKSELCNLSCVACVFGVISKKPLLIQRFALKFSSRSFTILVLTFCL